MKAVVSVTAKDAKGIIAKVSAEVSAHGANILDISQTVMGEYFAMIMLIEFDEGQDFGAFVDHMKQLGGDSGLVIHVMHEDIFNSMHRI